MRLTRENTAIVLDSTADFPDATERFPNMRVVPLYVRFGEESFRDYVELAPTEFYERLRTAPELPTTSQPTPQDFLQAYEELAGYERIYSLHISSKLSGTFASASLAAGEVAPERVRLVDTESVSVAIAMLALEVAAPARAWDDRRGDRRRRRAAPDRHGAPVHRRHARVPRQGRPHRTGAGACRQPAEREADPHDRGWRGAAAHPCPRPPEGARGVPQALRGGDERRTRALRGHRACRGARRPSRRSARSCESTRPAAQIELVSPLGAVVGTHAGPGTVGFFWFQNGA